MTESLGDIDGDGKKKKKKKKSSGEVTWSNQRQNLSFKDPTLTHFLLYSVFFKSLFLLRLENPLSLMKIRTLR